MSKKIEAFKFMPSQFADDFLKRGVIKLGAAAEFRAIEGSNSGRGDENELRQVWDMEGTHHLKNDDPLLLGLGGPPPLEANLNGLIINGEKGAVMNLNLDALIYCASTELDSDLKSRMASEFNADACVRISDFAEFARLISIDGQVWRTLNWAGADYVQYVDSKRVKRYMGAKPFEKERAFGWQKEIRAIWDVKPAAKESRIIGVPAITSLLTREF